MFHTNSDLELLLHGIPGEIVELTFFLDSLSTASGAEGTLSRSLELFSKWTRDISKVFGKKMTDDFKKKTFQVVSTSWEACHREKSSKYS